MRQAHRLSRCRIASLLLVVIALLGTHRARAADFLQGEIVVVEADKVMAGDLFVTAQSAVILGKIEGDLFVMAQSIEVKGQVLGSAYLAGEILEISGQVGGSVRSAGNSITLQTGAEIARDWMVAGNALVSEADSQVLGQLYLAGATANLAGHVTGIAHLAVDRAEVSGSFDADLLIESSASTTTGSAETALVIAEGATIGGDLRIRSPREPTISDGATIGGESVFVAADQSPAEPADPVRAYVRLWLLIWAQLLLVGLGFRLVLPGRTTRYLNNLHRLPILSALLGPVYWLLILAGGGLAIAATATAAAGLYVVEFWDMMPLVLLIGFVIVVTVWGGGGLLGFVLGPVLTGVWFCRTLLGWMPGFRRDSFLLPVLLGTGLVSAGCAIPDFGWIVWLVTASLGSGAFLTRSQAEPPPARPYVASAAPPKARIT